MRASTVFGILLYLLTTLWSPINSLAAGTEPETCDLYGVAHPVDKEWQYKEYCCYCLPTFGNAHLRSKSWISICNEGKCTGFASLDDEVDYSKQPTKAPCRPMKTIENSKMYVHSCDGKSRTEVK